MVSPERPKINRGHLSPSWSVAAPRNVGPAVFPGSPPTHNPYKSALTQRERKWFSHKSLMPKCQRRYLCTTHIQDHTTVIPSVNPTPNEDSIPSVDPTLGNSHTITTICSWNRGSRCAHGTTPLNIAHQTACNTSHAGKPLRGFSLPGKHRIRVDVCLCLLH